MLIVLTEDAESRKMFREVVSEENFKAYAVNDLKENLGSSADSTYAEKVFKWFYSDKTGEPFTISNGKEKELWIWH